MEDYVGYFPVDIKDSPYAEYTVFDFAMHFIEKYGQIDGAHHKDWVLDQVARILKGTKPLVFVRKWTYVPGLSDMQHDGEHYLEYDLTTGEPSDEYKEWVEWMLDRDPDGEPQYDYDVGVPP